MGNRIIEVVDYKPCWIEKYQSESEHIKQSLNPLAITLHHIGSTSVPGLSAKPIIDILAEVDDLFYFDQVSQKLELLEYEGKGEFGISGRRYFKKGSERHSYHLHVFASGDSNIHRHICFRNYLVAHPEVAKEYGELKKRIAARCDHDTVVYCDEKNDFVQYHQSLAIQWSKEADSC